MEQNIGRFSTNPDLYSSTGFDAFSKVKKSRKKKGKDQDSDLLNSPFEISSESKKRKKKRKN
jgi:hypothetical protein